MKVMLANKAASGSVIPQASRMPPMVRVLASPLAMPRPKSDPLRL